ncbi:MAG: hypothetical protein GF368_01385 [Candidatus Aenigmarchaeota archaeon]|nr:hypothetical protein [Candidatus Aenigmarchaeota archaeon]
MSDLKFWVYHILQNETFDPIFNNKYYKNIHKINSIKNEGLLKMTNTDQINNSLWILGIPFLGVGITFFTSVNKGLGISFIAIGISWIAIGLYKRRE